MRLSEFDYELPRELIAQYPVRKRDKCRLMVLDRKAGTIAHKSFEDIAGYFASGDCLVLNNTKVVPARLFGKRTTGGKVEIFLLEHKKLICEALVRPSARLDEGERIMLESGDEVEVIGRGDVGRFVRFARPPKEIMKAVGHMPLPPYIGRNDKESDKNDYQTVYGSAEGATASPTAGLHFTRELLARVTGHGARVTYLTLHTSYGTFAPIKEEEVEKHKMHKEYFELPAEATRVVSETKDQGGSVFAVGTTSTRVLEHCASLSTRYSLLATPCNGNTDMFIYPGYKFKVVDHLITNFHLPKSTLLLLVSAFAGKDLLFEAYREAIAKRYRFFSYGDAMLIL